MVRHVALERGDGDVAFLYGLIISAFGRVPCKIFFADPVVRLAARVYVLADDGARVLQSLPRDFYAFDLTARNVDIKQRSVRQSFLQDFAHGCDGEARGFSEIE